MNKIIDFHNHTSFSFDSTTDMREHVIAAIERGVTDLAITDHVDLDPNMNPEKHSWFDRDAYFETIESMQEEFSGKISIYKGIELGVQKHLTEACAQQVKGKGYDMVIASVHCVEKQDIYFSSFYEQTSYLDAIHRYYEEMIESAKKMKDYSVIGHMDLFLRYLPALREIDVKEYIDHATALFEIIIPDGRGIEVNAGALRYGMTSFNPSRALLARYYEMGGTIITYGSDSHTPDTIAVAYQDVMKQLYDIGFRSICTFSSMEPRFHEITS